MTVTCPPLRARQDCHWSILTHSSPTAAPFAAEKLRCGSEDSLLKPGPSADLSRLRARQGQGMLGNGPRGSAVPRGPGSAEVGWGRE